MLTAAAHCNGSRAQWQRLCNTWSRVRDYIIILIICSTSPGALLPPVQSDKNHSVMLTILAAINLDENMNIGMATAKGMMIAAMPMTSPSIKSSPRAGAKASSTKLVVFKNKLRGLISGQPPAKMSLPWPPQPHIAKLGAVAAIPWPFARTAHLRPNLSLSRANFGA